ncbi:hypothetical protein WJX72_008218 [[Myrmecia] bisecta]|uniref:GAF domain-containing protein n=1 Tax=[Myrmecia] bisecta TaxID=41462 RepID=A0AAW1PWQ5_9CHLO
MEGHLLRGSGCAAAHRCVERTAPCRWIAERVRPVSRAALDCRLHSLQRQPRSAKCHRNQIKCHAAANANQPAAVDTPSRAELYVEVQERIDLLLEGETDMVAAMATVACELHQSFDHFHWTGFYRVLPALKDWLVIGPYQGTHGCLRIEFGRGVCGAAAKTRKTQLVPDVHSFPGHIACASSTQSEIVVPILDERGDVIGVLDVDSNDPAAFNEVDQQGLEALCKLLGQLASEQETTGR